MTSASIENTIGAKSKKRERNEVFDESYVKNKRILQEGFKSLTLVEPEKENSVIDSPAYGQYDKCPVNEPCRSDSECRWDPNYVPVENSMDEGSDELGGDSLERKQSIDSYLSRSTESDEDRSCIPDEAHEIMLSLVKGGKRKYIRKVDYLVDEIIRKTRKITDVPIYCDDHDAILPPNIGPSPRTDQAISILVPFSTNFCSLSSNQNGPPLLEYPKRKSSSPPPILLSGEITHSDWGIEEINNPLEHNQVDSQCTAVVPYVGARVNSSNSNRSIGIPDETDNTSNMACCDDSSLLYSSNCSIRSQSSDMMVDSDDEEVLQRHERLVNEVDDSNNFVGAINHGQSFLPSNNVPSNEDASRSAIVDDEEESIVNIGTF